MITPDYQDNDITLYKADCLEVLSQRDMMNSIDLVLTDPPYLITSRGNSGDTGGMLNTEASRSGKIFKHNELKLENFLFELYNTVKEGSHCYLFTNNKNLEEYLTAIRKQGYVIYKTLIWVKNNKITNQYYMDSHEYIIFFRKGYAKKINNCGTSSVLSYNNPTNKFHPTEKPVDLLKTLILNSTNEGDTVLDFTMGSGSTGVACKETGRKFIGIEIDDEFYYTAKQRITNTNKNQSLEDLI